jgi:hypothetical protein
MDAFTTKEIFCLILDAAAGDILHSVEGFCGWNALTAGVLAATAFV